MVKSKPTAPTPRLISSAPVPGTYVVEYHDQAALELAEIKQPKDRVAVATTAKFLRALGLSAT